MILKVACLGMEGSCQKFRMKEITSKQLAKSLESDFQSARPGTGNEGSTNNLFMKVIISKWLANVLKSD